MTGWAFVMMLAVSAGIVVGAGLGFLFARSRAKPGPTPTISEARIIADLRRCLLFRFRFAAQGDLGPWAHAVGEMDALLRLLPEEQRARMVAAIPPQARRFLQITTPGEGELRTSSSDRQGAGNSTREAGKDVQSPESMKIEAGLTACANRVLAVLDFKRKEVVESMTTKEPFSDGGFQMNILAGDTFLWR